MSKHPLGPWTDIVDDNTIVIPGGSYIQSLNGIADPKGYQSGVPVRIQEIRTGVESGGRIDLPQPASLSLKKTTVDRGACIVSKRVSGAGGRFTEVVELADTVYIPVMPASKLSASSAHDAAFIKLTKKVAPEFSGTVFIGEFKSFREDFKFLVDTMSGHHNKVYQELVENLKKHRKGSKRDLMQIVSDHWLTYQFGMVPDIMDLTSLVKALHHSAQNSSRPAKISASWKDDAMNNVLVYRNLICSPGTRCSVRRTEKVIGKVGASLRKEFVNKDVSFPDRFGVGFEDFVPAMYELLPFSWLADYFSNLGDIVNLLAFRRGVWENGWFVTIVETIDDGTIELQKPDNFSPPWIVQKNIAGTYRQRSFTFNRGLMNVDTYLPKLKAERVPNLRQAANIAAVAATMFSGRKSMNSLTSILARRGG